MSHAQIMKSYLPVKMNLKKFHVYIKLSIIVYRNLLMTTVLKITSIFIIILYVLWSEKSTLRLFCIESNSVLRNGTGFSHYRWKFGHNIFPDLKSKQIKLKKTKFAHFFVILTKIKFVYTFENINFLKTIHPTNETQTNWVLSWFNSFSFISLFGQICSLG